MEIKISEIKALEGRHMINTYRRDPDRNILIIRGRGSYVWDESGHKYLDFVSGLAVNSLGHAHPAIVKALQDQAEKLIHTSNLYYTEAQVELATLLARNSFGRRVFLANSGAEANEAAIKLARKYSKSAWRSQIQDHHGGALFPRTHPGHGHRYGPEPLS